MKEVTETDPRIAELLTLWPQLSEEAQQSLLQVVRAKVALGAVGWLGKVLITESDCPTRTYYEMPGRHVSHDVRKSSVIADLIYTCTIPFILIRFLVTFVLDSFDSKHRRQPGAR